MGIFSFFSRNDDDEDEEDLLEEDQDEVPSHTSGTTTAGTIDVGMRLDVVKDGQVLLSGQVSEYANEKLALIRLPGALSFKICPLGSDVFIKGYDRRLVAVHFSGTVEESNRISFKLKNVKPIIQDEGRDNFRLPISTPVTLYRHDDERHRNPEHCQLVDISTGGCCIRTEYVHMEDEVIQIQIKLEDYAPLSFLGQIIRCSEHDGQFQYGVLFAQMTEPETAALRKTLYNIQMGIKQTHMRTDDGYWGAGR